MTEQPRRTSFPALRCQMGDWIYYVTCLRFADINDWVKKTDEIHTSESLRDMIQRQIHKRVDPIVEYLQEQDERFFNAIVLGVYGGTPQWYPIEVGSSPVLGNPELDDDARDSIGILKLEGDEKLFAIDGQHRVVAIQKIMAVSSAHSKEEICAIFVPHLDSKAGKQRTRRLFSTLNRYAVPVSKGEIVALSEDDAFAIVTRRLVEEFPLLLSNYRGNSGFVAFNKTTPIPSSDKKSLTSILALYDIVTTLHTPITIVLSKDKRKVLKRLKHRCPTEETLNKIFLEQTSYWELLKNHIKEYGELFSSSPAPEVAGKYRENGGHLMFRPAGQQAFARAVRIMMDRSWTMKKAVTNLAKTPMTLNTAPWRGILWNANEEKMNTKISPLLTEGILLNKIGQPSRNQDFNVLDEYRKVLGNDKAEL